jgi:hypothetical protein
MKLKYGGFKDSIPNFFQLLIAIARGCGRQKMPVGPGLASGYLWLRQQLLLM